MKDAPPGELREVLLNPGPVNVSERVRRALLCPDICHREPELLELLGSVRSNLLRAFAPAGGYHAAILAGSGTVAVESMVRASVAPGRKLLVIDNGIYGRRMIAMAQRAGIGVHEITAGWFDHPTLGSIGSALDADDTIDAVAIVHHETTTGLLNPMHDVAEIARARGKRLVVDSVSGLGGDAIDLSGLGAALCAGTAGKCIQGFPGVGFVLIADSELKRIGERAGGSVYMDLSAYVAADGRALIPFTPPVQLLSAFDAALEELLEETVDGRIDRYRSRALFVRQALSERGLDLLVAEEWRSNCLTAVALPTGTTYTALHDALKQRGFVIYAGQGDLQRTAFRVSTMGTITHAELERFITALDESLATQ